MRLLLTMIFVTTLAGCGSSVAGQRSDVAVTPAATPKMQSEKRPVIVELFTSEGCSSCPPADRELALLDGRQPNDDADIIALEMHVDYWDRLGWKDPFSSAAYTSRQESYIRALGGDSSYTPQMIVDGTTEFVGSDGAAAARSVAAAVRETKARVSLVFKDGKLTADISEIPEASDADVFLAITEDDLTTDVRAGENGGSRLAHRAVVRELREIGKVAAGIKNARVETSIEASKNWQSEKLRLVIFLQEKKSRRIFGAARIGFK